MELAQHATVINYDQRGCGETEYDGQAHTLEDLAGDAAELLDHLGYRSASVLGTSLGGRVAQAFAMFRPAYVDKLILCNTWPIDRLLTDLHPDGLRHFREMTEGLPGTAREVALMYYSEQFVNANPFVIERARARAKFPARMQRRALGAELHADAVARIQAPVLLLSGDQDRIVPPSVMRGMAETFPNARLIVVPGAAHSAAIQMPRTMAKLVAENL